MSYPISDGWYTGEAADDLLRSIDEANDRDWSYAYEEESAAEAQERMTPAEQQADIDWKQRWEAMVKSGEINDPFAEAP